MRSLVLACCLTLLVGAASGIKLKFKHSECVTESIHSADSLVTISLVSLAAPGKKVYFDLKVVDPVQQTIFTKTGTDESEFAFKSRQPGQHTLCLTVNPSSTDSAHDTFQEVLLDVAVGEPWEHDRITKDHVDTLTGELQELATRVQRLRSEVRYLKFREARHRQTVDSTHARVGKYALLKGVVLVSLSITQVALIHVFFRSQSRL